MGTPGGRELVDSCLFAFVICHSLFSPNARVAPGVVLQHKMNHMHAPDRLATEDVLGRRWALGLGGALVLLLAVVEAEHWQAAFREGAAVEQIVQQPAHIASPAARAEPYAPDPGDDP